MTATERDDELEQYLQQRTMLPHRLAEAEKLEPPAEIDRLVLAHAREAIRASTPTPVYRSARWALPFGLAATLILAFAVLLHMRSPAQKEELGAANSEPVVVETRAAMTEPPLGDMQLRSEANSGAPAYAAPHVAPRAVAERVESHSSDDALAASSVTKQMSPEQWLAKIKRLRSEGKELEADRERAAFQKAYPSYRATASSQ